MLDPLLLCVVFCVKDQPELIFLEESFVVEVVRLRFGVVDKLGAKERVKSKSEHIFKHSRDEAFE